MITNGLHIAVIDIGKLVRFPRRPEPAFSQRD
jgi:hypothetical protein